MTEVSSDYKSLLIVCYTLGDRCYKEMLRFSKVYNRKCM